jgi:hypothetical protein
MQDGTMYSLYFFPVADSLAQHGLEKGGGGKSDATEKYTQVRDEMMK